MSNLSVMFDDVRMTELGKIKIGGLGEARKSKSGTSYRQPQKHDHFTITMMNRGPDVGGARGDLVPDVELMDQLKQDKGLTNGNGELVRLPVFVLSNDIGDILQSGYVWYGGRTVGARSDGVTVTWLNDRTNGQRLDEPMIEDWTPKLLELTNSKGAPLFKQHTIFNCVIAAQDARWGGVYKFRTTSVITARQLYSGLVNLSTLTNGMLAGLPLYLFVRPIQVAPNGKSITVYVVGVEMRGSDMKQIMDRAAIMARMLLSRAAEIKRIQEAQRRMLVAPGYEGGDEAGSINAEFSPGTIEDETEGTPSPIWSKIMDGEEVPAEANEASGEIPRCPDCGEEMTEGEHGAACASCQDFGKGESASDET